MKLNGSFLKKMIFANCASVFLMTAVFVVIQLNIDIKSEKMATQDVLEQFAEKSSSQVDLLVGDMEKMSYSIATSDSIISALMNANRYVGQDNYFDLSQNERRSMLNFIQVLSGSSFGDKSVSIVSSQGDYVNLGTYFTIDYTRAEMRQRSQMETLKPSINKYMVPVGSDIYGRTDTPMFSFIRKIADEFGVYGYVDVQESASSLNSIFRSSLDSFDIITVMTYNNSYFYTYDQSGTEGNWASSLDLLIKEGVNKHTHKIRLNGDTYLLYTTSLDKYGLTLYSLVSAQSYTPTMLRSIGSVILLGIAFAIFMCTVTIVVTNRLYRPVRELRDRMNELQFNDLQIDLHTKDENDEIELFNQSFNKMIDSIRRQNNELIDRKIRELQISYQALQAQVSPHFLYNTLYVIGLNGEQNGMPEVMDMCSNLTKMMSYSLSSKNSLVPFYEEIEYMQYYLVLMQYRYLDKLEYHVDMEDAIKSLSVPKFILQPLVENCFTHGFKNCTNDKYIIRITGKLTENGWTVRVEDNGTGFSEENKQKVFLEMKNVYQSVKNPNANFVNEITGIGLVNTYARLLLGLSGEVIIRIDHSSLSGGLVEIQYTESSSHAGGQPS